MTLRGEKGMKSLAFLFYFSLRQYKYYKLKLKKVLSNRDLYIKQCNGISFLPYIYCEDKS